MPAPGYDVVIPLDWAKPNNMEEKERSRLCVTDNWRVKREVMTARLENLITKTQVFSTPYTCEVSYT